MRPVKCNFVSYQFQPIPCKRFWPIYNKNTKNKHYYTPLAVILYATNPQNTISQTALKNYNKFKSVRTEALRWLQTTTDTGIELKVETTVKERYQKLLDFVTIDELNIGKQHPSFQEFITLSMT